MMAEVKTSLLSLAPGEQYAADSDGAFVIEDRHTHADILRYVVADLGVPDTIQLLKEIAHDSGVSRRRFSILSRHGQNESQLEKAA